MADELQALLDRITEEGLKKANEERQAILEKAALAAQRTVVDAKAEAAALLEEARRESALLKEKGEQALRQAARDVMLSLRAELERRVVEVARLAAAKALDPAAMAATITELARGFAESGGREQRIEVLLNPAHVEALAETLAAALGTDLRTRVDLRPVPTVKAGFRIKASGSDVAYDFTDEALAEAMAAFLSPRLAAIMADDAR
jgi:V/A-type H+-transporting ATPase subunit E